MEITTYDASGRCLGRNTTCRRTLPPRAIAAGLAYDETTDSLFVTVSTPLSTGGWSTLAWIASAASPCEPRCESPVFNCTRDFVTGLAYDSCRRRLYATDGQITQTVFVSSVNNCALKLGTCCKKQIAPVYRGLAVIPGWKKQTAGASCTRRPCPSCPSMKASCSGDPALGTNFAITLQNAPTPAFALLFVKAGSCGSGFALPSPFCGRWYAFPQILAYPAATLSASTQCGASARQVLPIPASAGLCGRRLCAQWFVVCRGAVGFGFGFSNAIEFPITG